MLGQRGHSSLAPSIPRTNSLQQCSVLRLRTRPKYVTCCQCGLVLHASTQQALLVFRSLHTPTLASRQPSKTDFMGLVSWEVCLERKTKMATKCLFAYSTPPTTIVNWIVLVERTSADVYGLVTQLRTIILACLFSGLGFCFFASISIAHWATRPITRLRAATESIIDPIYGASDNSFKSTTEVADATVTSSRPVRKKGFVFSLLRWRGRQDIHNDQENHQGHQKRFRIPSKVDAPKHWVKDGMYTMFPIS